MSQIEQVRVPELGVAALTGHRVVRVNLLPSEIADARRLRLTQSVLAGGLVLVLAGMGGLYALEVSHRKSAERDLAAVQADTTRLEAEQAKFADVPKVISAIDAAETARQGAMADDVEWYRTLTNLSLTLPANVWFTNLSLTVTPPEGSVATSTASTPPSTSTSTGKATTGKATTGTASVGASGGTGAAVSGGAAGLVTVEGLAMDHPDVATWLDTLAKQPGMAGAYFTTSERTLIGKTSVVKYQSTAVLTDEALSHRYDRKQG
jgi:Tfp pilus assembly protein PilN